MSGNNNINNCNTTDEQDTLEKETENMKAVLQNDAEIETQTLKLTDLPSIPLRKIFKLLRGKGSPNDRSNLTLRLVSKSVKEIVDTHVVMIWSIHLWNYLEIPDKYEMFENSDRDISIRLLSLAVEKEEVKLFIRRFSNRIIYFSGYLWPIQHFANAEGLTMPKMERLVLTAEVTFDDVIIFERPALTNTLLSNLPNLSFLKLRGNSLSEIKNSVLPCLKSLNLYHMETEDFDHLPSLLSSCSSTLEEIEIKSKCPNFSPLRSLKIEMKRLRKVDVVVHKFAFDLPALLSFLPQSLESLYLLSLRDILDCSNSLSYDFPNLKNLWLESIDLKPLLSLLCRPRKLERVELAMTDLTSIKNQRFKVTSIKNLVLNVPSEDDILYEYFEDIIMATYEFLVGCADSTENIKINEKVVDHCHLLSGNFVTFKEQYIDRNCHFESSSSVTSDTEESSEDSGSSSSWETIDTESSSGSNDMSTDQEEPGRM